MSARGQSEPQSASRRSRRVPSQPCSSLCSTPCGSDAVNTAQRYCVPLRGEEFGSAFYSLQGAHKQKYNKLQRLEKQRQLNAKKVRWLSCCCPRRDRDAAGSGFPDESLSRAPAPQVNQYKKLKQRLGTDDSYAARVMEEEADLDALANAQPPPEDRQAPPRQEHQRRAFPRLPRADRAQDYTHSRLRRSVTRDYASSLRAQSAGGSSLGRLLGRRSPPTPTAATRRATATATAAGTTRATAERRRKRRTSMPSRRSRGKRRRRGGSGRRSGHGWCGGGGCGDHLFIWPHLL